MKRLHEQRKGQKGFTLIEIIAVLVILGVLAAVAVPRYFDMQTEARSRAVESGGAEIQARITQLFAQRLLAGTACGEAAVVAVADIEDDDNSVGGWTIAEDNWPDAAGEAGSVAITSAVDNTITGNVTVRLPACQ